MLFLIRIYVDLAELQKREVVIDAHWGNWCLDQTLAAWTRHTIVVFSFRSCCRVSSSAEAQQLLGRTLRRRKQGWRISWGPATMMLPQRNGSEGYACSAAAAAVEKMSLPTKRLVWAENWSVNMTSAYNSSTKFSLF